MKIKFKQQGFSLIEILLVIGLISLLAVGVFIIFSQVKDASDSNTESQNLTTIIAGVRNLYGGRADYTGINTNIVNGANIFPRPMNGGDYAPGTLIQHVAGGAVDVEPWGPGNERFAVIYRSLPTRICVKIAQNYGKNVERVMVNGVVVKDFGDIGTDPSRSMAACSEEALVSVSFIQK